MQSHARATYVLRFVCSSRIGLSHQQHALRSESTLSSKREIEFSRLSGQGLVDTHFDRVIGTASLDMLGEWLQNGYSMGRPSLDPQWDTNDSPHLRVPRDHVYSSRCIELRRGSRSWVAPIIEHRIDHQGRSRGGLVRERLPRRPVPPTQLALEPRKRHHIGPCAAPARVPGWCAKR